MTFGRVRQNTLLAASQSFEEWEAVHPFYLIMLG